MWKLSISSKTITGMKSTLIRSRFLNQLKTTKPTRSRMTPVSLGLASILLMTQITKRKRRRWSLLAIKMPLEKSLRQFLNVISLPGEEEMGRYSYNYFPKQFSTIKKWRQKSILHLVSLALMPRIIVNIEWRALAKTLWLTSLTRWCLKRGKDQIQRSCKMNHPLSDKKGARCKKMSRQ